MFSPLKVLFIKEELMWISDKVQLFLIQITTEIFFKERVTSSYIVAEHLEKYFYHFYNLKEGESSWMKINHISINWTEMLLLNDLSPLCVQNCLHTVSCRQELGGLEHICCFISPWSYWTWGRAAPGRTQISPFQDFLSAFSLSGSFGSLYLK